MAAWSKWSDGQFRVAEETIDEYRRLRAWARERGATVVLPMTERSCLLCNAERDAWEAAGMAVGCAPDATLLRAFDKARTLEAAQRCGITTPPTRVPTSQEEYHEAAQVLGFPCVVKSRFSDAWVGQDFVRGGGATYVASPADLAAAVRAHRQGPHWPIIQGLVRGQGKGVSGLCDRGRTVALFAHERLRDVRPTGSGSSLRRSITLDERLREPVERLLSEMEWHGPVMVELKDDGGDSPCLMEVNGRFWGSLQLAVLSGVDVPAWWVGMLEGIPVRPSAGYREGVALRWLWGDVKRLFRIYQGPPSGYPDAYPTLRDGLREVLGSQPAGTRIETWDAADPLPAAGEWVQGAGELFGFGMSGLRGARMRKPVAAQAATDGVAGSG